MSPNSTTVSEDVGSITFTINRSSGATSETVYFSTVQNQGTINNNDYVGRDTVAVSFSAGVTSKTISVAINDDNVIEGTETFSAWLENSGGTLLDTSTFTINDDDTGATSDAVANDITSTTALSVDQTIIGTIDQFDFDGNYIDKDYYKVVLSAGQSYTFSADANQSTTDTLDQVYMRLRDSNGNSITPSAADEGSTPSFTYDVPGSGSQTYYLAVSAGGDGTWWDKTGDFSLDFIANGAVTVANQTPYAQGSSKTVAPGDSVALTELFTYGDRDGLSDIVSFAVQDRSFDGGYLTFNGVKQEPNTIFEKPIGEIDQWAFMAGSTGSDTVGFNAIDGHGAFNSSVIATITAQSTTPSALSASKLFAASGGKTTALAEFALAAYFQKNLDVKDSLIEKGWETPNIYGLDSDGYYKNGKASAFIAESDDGDSLVIAFTGTDSKFFTIHDNDFLDYPAMAVHYERFASLFNEINFADYTNVYVTGHSLGGVMVQAFMVDPPAKLTELANPPHIEAVAFANPGYGNSLLSQVDNLVNISIRGDSVAELGVDTVVAGDRFWINPTEYSTPSSFPPTARHDMDLYYAVAKYIDGSYVKNEIESKITNSSDDFSEKTLYLNGSPESGYTAMTPVGAKYNPLEILVTEVPSAIIDAKLQAFYETTGVVREVLATSHRINVVTSDTISTTLEVSADVADVVISTYIDGNKYLLNKAVEFSSLLLKAGGASLEAIIKPLDGTDIAQNTVYFEGGLSDDVLSGSAADRHLVADGGAGDDKLTGGLMGDDLRGGAGNDNIQGGAGDDSIRDALGADVLDGGADNDQVILFSGTNGAYGGAGNDFIIGGVQSDVLIGDAGNDIIRGDVGSGAFGGKDIIDGGADNDIMMGGVGADVFIFGANDGSDVIAKFDVADVAFDVTNGYSVNPSGADFEVGIDHLQLEGFSAVNTTNVMSFVSDGASGAVFSAEGTDITLYGVDAAYLTTDVFVFV